MGGAETDCQGVVAAHAHADLEKFVAAGQIGQQGVTILGYNIITAKPSANAVITGIGGAAF